MKHITLINQFWLLAWLCMLTVSSCSRQPSATRQLVIAIRKTACYGSCPVYTVEIYDDQSVIYIGERFVPLEGEHLFRIEKKTLEGLINSFVESDFFNFDSDYTAGVTDLPTTYVEFIYDGETKKIRDYYGAPSELKALEKKVEEFVEKNIWKGKAN